MEIYTKFMPGGTDETGNISKVYRTLERIFKYAVEVLGDNYSYTVIDPGTDTEHSDFRFTDPSGSGEHGWRIWYKEGSYVPTILSCCIGDDQHTPFTTIAYTCPDSLADFTALVWKSSDGSVGIGYKDVGGRYMTCFLLIKFNGKYGDTDMYGVTCNHGSTQPGPLIVHGHTDIGLVNHCPNGDIGSGVYLHPLFDPVSGLVSSDIFGVQSMGSNGYSHNGTIIKQGGTSYMSVLGGHIPTNVNTQNTLFVKM